MNQDLGPTNRWIRQFLQRHDLTDRMAENMSAVRATMSTPEVIDEFFDFYEEIVDQYNIRDKPAQVKKNAQPFKN